MTYIQSYKELIVWQKSMLLVKEIYILTASFPKSEVFSLVSQIRRAAISIPSNIAEGYGRKSSKEYAQFYAIAYGSCLELETQLLIAQEVGYIEAKEAEKVFALLKEVSAMLNAMLSKMRKLNAAR
jgi:four helix bundle protein